MMDKPAMKLKGFTLIEMVVALTILSLIVLATVTALRTLAKTQNTLNVRTENIAEMRAVSRFLRTGFSQVPPIKVSTIRGGSISSFYGTRENIVWAAPMALPGSQGGLSTLKLYVNDARQLILLVLPFTLINPDWTNANSYVLVEGVQAFSIAYKSAQLTDWLQAWESEVQPQSPSHIKLALQVDDRYWPELIVAL